MSYFSTLTSALKTTANLAYHATGASQVVQGANELVRNAGAGGTWTGMAKGAARMAVGGAALYTLPSAPLRNLAVMGAGKLIETTRREDVGRAIKRTGKALGNQRMIETGRQLHYGHLSPEQLFKKHPAAFLRSYAVQGAVQAPDDPGGTSNTATQFQFRTITNRTSIFPNLRQITDRSGVTRTPRGHLELIKSSDAGQHQALHGSVQVGHDFSAAFLPMLQSSDDRLTSRGRSSGKPSHQTVSGFDHGRVRDRSLNRRGESIVVTTQLSGCSVTRQSSAFLHIRPHTDGATLHSTLARQGPTFGRNDYPGGQRAFVMIRRKSDGSARLHYQIHDADNGTIRSGRRRF
ncbi:MAG TPA: hypothetical protein DDZ76_08990 [Xanthomonadales bacterium]|nr:hypothetical protein [Xanthomonadales bacterium]